MTSKRQSFRRAMFGVGTAFSGGFGMVLLWLCGMDLLIGTPFEELRFVVFVVVAFVMLSTLERLISQAPHA